MSSLSQFLGGGTTIIADTQYLSGSGTHTFNTATKFYTVIAVGGGGGGAAENNQANCPGAHGGGAGSVLQTIFAKPSSVTSAIYSVGTAGVGAAQNSNTAGTSGGNTQFGHLISMGGGGALPSPGDEGVGGFAEDALINNTTMQGNNFITQGGSGGLGGQGGASAANGNNGKGPGGFISGPMGGTGGTFNPGAGGGGGGGGSSLYGKGGNGGNGANAGNASAGTSGTGYGSGGGGGGGSISGLAGAGGDGTAGYLRVIEYT